MKQSAFTISQIIHILEKVESGIPVTDLCQEYGISSATLERWRNKYSGMDASIMTRLKELEDENQRLKKMYLAERMKSEPLEQSSEKKG